MDKIESLILYKYGVDMVSPELLFPGPVDYGCKISDYIDCFPIYFNIKAGYEEIFPVLIKFQDSVPLSISVFQGLYIGELKRQIQIIKSISDQLVLLEFRGKKLLNDKRINDYNIQKDDEITMKVKQISKKGHYYFGIKKGVYKSNSNYNFSQEEQESRYSISGLNVEGMCTNPGCKEANNMVICPVGEGIFDTMRQEASVVCPLCREVVTPTNYYAVNCMFAWLAVTQAEEGKTVKKTAQKIRFVPNMFSQISPADKLNHIKEKLKLEKLKLVKFLIYTKVEEKEETSSSEELQLSHRRDDEIFCSVCKSFLNKEMSNVYGCGHFYHKICGHMLPAPLNNLCPICLI